MQLPSKYSGLLRRGLLFLLLATNFALALVILEQSHTIDSQRQLIHQLYQDSLELHAVRVQQHLSRNQH